MGGYLTQGLHRALQQRPDAVATICGERTRTFAEQADRVARAAGALLGLGVRPGDRVAILSQNSDHYAELLLAVAWADAVVVPVNIRWSAAEIDLSLHDCEAGVLFVDEAFAGLVPQLTRELTVIGMGENRDGRHLDDLIAEAGPVPDVRRGGGSPAGIFYTGGTTGTPKGVVLSHDNVLASAMGSAATGHLHNSPDDRVLHVAPMFHIACFTSWLIGSLAGATHVMVPGFQPDAVLDAIERHRVTATFLVPTMVTMLLADPTLPKRDVSTLRRVLYGASPMPQSTLETAMSVLPGTRFTQAYGMTELSPVATLLGHEDHVPGRLRSAGRAAPHTEVRVVGEDGTVLPVGEVGEVAVRGANAMIEYWNRPKETAEALRDGWMHTGDAGYLDADGYLFVVDRYKDMVITGGENVYSVEVENALAGHSAVAMCAVIGLPDPRWGERVHAVVVLAEGAAATEEELREHVRGLIAGYKVPRSVEFVDALPISGPGKILKHELRSARSQG
ncbi:long-chain fatty acid--CoA ligase [Actinocorallia sp. B10E7]|uniref:acyl-CoA synthetase n=1 Tax=Actinocorallia sp. B10E7 TaxID=3153558 RepID=UPI00325E8355